MSAHHPSAPTTRARRLSFCVATLLSAGVLWYFHNRYWYPTDDGFYGNIAERLLNGERLGRDIQDLHPGYIHAVNTAAMRVFGVSLVSMRYPLIAASLAQSWVVFALFVRRSALLAGAMAVLTVAVGAIQFLDPTPNWYCLALATATAVWFTHKDVTSRRATFAAGLLLGATTMFRQLSGVWLAMGIVFVLLRPQDGEAADRRSLAGRFVLLVMFAATVWYVRVSPGIEPDGVVIMAIWPAALLAVALWQGTCGDGEALKRLGSVAAGAAVAGLPIIVYHIAHHSLGEFLHDTVTASFNLTQMPFFGGGWYRALSLAALYNMLFSFDGARSLNAFYWEVLTPAALVNGALVLWRFGRGTWSADLALPAIASFYALVSLFLEGPLYLYYSAGLTLTALAWQLARSQRHAAAASTIASVLAATGIFFHAGQPRDRAPLQILNGERTAHFSAQVEGPRRSGLLMSAVDRDTYERLVQLVQERSGAGDAILALPNDAELYFLAERRNPFRFYNSALGLQRQQDLESAVRLMAHDPPRVVLFRPGDKYNNAASAALMEVVHQRYAYVETVGGLELYVLPAPRLRAGGS